METGFSIKQAIKITITVAESIFSVILLATTTWN